MFEHRIIYLEEQVEKMSLCVKMLAHLAVQHDNIIDLKATINSLEQR